jgi:hypothetical protein
MNKAIARARIGDNMFVPDSDDEPGILKMDLDRYRIRYTLEEVRSLAEFLTDWVRGHDPDPPKDNE